MVKLKNNITTHKTRTTIKKITAVKINKPMVNKMTNKSTIMKPLVELKNVSLTIDEKKIINNLSLAIWEGHVHAIVGPNGAGKSTLASIIMGLQKYKNIQGDILFEHKSIKHLDVSKRAKLGITLGWQEPARFEGLTVKQYLQASTRKNSSNAAIIQDALLRVGLDPKTYLKRAVDATLSGGERKRIELASLILMRPKLLILDEPDSGIDIEAIQRIFATIHYLNEQGTTILLITHSLEILKQADHAFLICHGQLMEKGTIDTIIPFFEEKCISCTHKNEPDKTTFTEKEK